MDNRECVNGKTHTIGRSTRDTESKFESWSGIVMAPLSDERRKENPAISRLRQLRAAYLG
jgi:hypothetical protein